jgi:hypothetical protein
MCEIRGPIIFDVCSTINHTQTDSNDWSTYVCQKGCDANMVQYTSTVTGFNNGNLGYIVNGCGYPELGQNWHFGNYVDLRPYLVPGVNTINFKVVVAGNGEGWVKVRTQACSMSQFAPVGDSPPVPGNASSSGVNDALTNASRQQ